MATSAEIKAQLAALGYTGPVSYTKTKLEQILAEQKAKQIPTPGPAKKPLLSYLKVQKDYDATLLYELQHTYSEVQVELKKLEKLDNVSAKMKRSQLAASQIAINERLTELWGKVGSTVQAGKVEASKAAADVLADSAYIFVEAGLSLEEVVMLKDSIRASAIANLDHLESRLKISRIPLSERVWGSEKLVHERLDYIINTHIARGTSARELAAAVRQFVNPNTPGGVRYAAQRLARTELNNAFHATTVQVAADLPFVTGMRWNLSGSHPIPDECDEYAGIGIFLPKDVPMKPHPNCLCYVTEELPSEDEFLDAFKEGKYNKWLGSDAPQKLEEKKWEGEPKPTMPTPPSKPEPPGESAYDEFIAESKKRFADFAKSTGNPKNDLTKSNNWEAFQRVVKKNDTYALQQLLNGKYIDQRLYDMAVEAAKVAKTIPAAEAAAYTRAMKQYDKAMASYTADYEAWRKANGVAASKLHGMDHATRHMNNDDGVDWANKNVHIATGAPRAAIKKYTGSDYSSINAALRKQADATKIPEGTWAETVKNADKAFKPLTEPVIVNRGSTWQEFVFENDRLNSVPPPSPDALIGTVQVQHGYMSTSVGSRSAFSSKQVQIKLLVPEGHGATWAMPYSRYESERELLLERGTQMYIHDVYKDDYNWVIEAEVIPMGVNPQDYVDALPSPSSKKFKP